MTTIFIRTTYLLIITFIFSSVNAQVDKRLIGKWKLVKIVEDTLTMTPPDSVAFHLIISESTFSYYLGVNTCGFEAKTIKKTIIDTLGFGGLCTEACCDEKAWKYSTKINYTGTYKLKKRQKTLIISNQESDLYLKRILK